MILLFRFASLIILVSALTAVAIPTHAQQEFPPPQGKGRIVVVISGKSGPAHYQFAASQIAQLGYDAVLFDGNQVEGTQGAALRTAIQQAQGMPHALPGKVGLVGFSLGGGMVLFYGSQWPDLASVVVGWYPATSFIRDMPGFVSRLRMPVLMLAGEDDTYRGCCLIGTARALAAAAAGRPFQLVTYPNTQHDFVYGGEHYNPQAYTDGMQRTAAELAQYLGR
jgi:pimeloyl-ACP methyl ester carboxylesterase